ncbi:PhzF family phenazine biosynthesis protein [Bacillus sp. AFS041924]|uniref:PhzF family phenazine biosynthesis protein n=1 Tax=Bacillus sp. AFS041924 TaxID=2033503 RepID=UPI000BFE7FD9|nr:PhzF family phenazine biosynthesis protein [Bacillus sp. AFS041924]PGS56402.1 isomerase [Bacillus sp. AFS041924]
MKKIRVYHYDAFSKEPNKGNPAGVVLDSDTLTEKEMQDIAKKVGFNETSFLLKSNVADHRIRYFTPGHEMDLCGHGTMAVIYALVTRGIIEFNNELTIETKAGILPISIHNSNNEIYITMKQKTPEFVEFNGSIDEVASSIGISVEEIDSTLPTLYGSTGAWNLLLPIKKLASFEKMKPNNQLFPSILNEIPNASIHPFCLETYDSNADFHARHFSSAFSGTIEDPVTGTASGIMGAYYAKYINSVVNDVIDLVVEQGTEIQRDGRVKVKVKKVNSNYEIEITGNAVYVKEMEFHILSRK